MARLEKKRSIFAKIRNYFIAGIVVLIPIGITIYLTLFLISISSRILPKEINPNHYLPYNIPGLEIVISILLITLIGSLSLSFIGKKLLDLIENILKRIPILRTIYSAIGQMTETFANTDKERNNVVLLTDLTHNTNKSYLKNPDDESRLFYVGATRTKENLHIIRPNDYEKAYPMENL